MNSLRTVLAVSIALSIPTSAMAQTRGVVRPAAPITEKQKNAVIDALIEAVETNYLFPDKAGDISAHLRELAGSERLGAIDDGPRFARELTDDLRDFTEDLHFAVQYDPESFRQRSLMEETAAPGAGRVGFGPGVRLPDTDSDLYKMMVDPFRRRNFDMRKLEVLDGNIGYMRLDMMPPLEPAKPTLDAAMEFLSGTDAMIIDLRGTPGGVGGFIPYLMSYFFAEKDKLLFSREFGAEGRTEDFRTHAEVGGKRRPEVPLYILTSELTGSAAENLAYTLKHHGRATIIGKNTAGGGHSARGVALAAGFTANIPYARVIHPETGRGFDRVGVEPDVEVPADQALDVAQRRILADLIAGADDPARAAELESVQRGLEEERLMAEAARKNADVDLSVYTGRYGIRTVSLEDGQLKYQREGGPRLPLRPVGKDLFRLDLPGGMRARGPVPDIRFERDGSDLVVGISLVREDGSVEEYLPKDDKG